MKMKKNNPKIILFDLETSFNIVATFDLYSAPIPHQNILREWFIICAAWKELGSSQVHSLCCTPRQARMGADVQIVRKLHKVLSEADAVIAHYGDKFDIPKLNARIINLGLPPLPDLIQIDTKKMASRKFKFNCNRLDYLGKYLGMGRKIKTEPELWLRCMEGEQKALNKMEIYNRGDVVLLEKVYNRLAPYLPSKVNRKLFSDRAQCPKCGSSRVQYRGFQYKSQRKYQRFQCLSCHGWSHDTKAV